MAPNLLVSASGRAEVLVRAQVHQRHLAAVLEYFWVVFRRTWRGSLMSRFASPLMFLGSLGLGLGALVDSSSGGVNGVPYLHFVVPALIANQAMWVAMGESTYQVMTYIMWNKMYRAMLATPLSVADVLVGHLTAVAGHLSLASVIFIGVCAALGAVSGWGLVVCLPVAVLTGLAFAVPLFAFTATQESDAAMSILFRLVVTPLMLFSGTFFPITSLPGILQPVAWVTPLWHGVELCRGAVIGGLGAGTAVAHLGVLLLYVGLGGWAAHRTFTRRLVP